MAYVYQLSFNLKPELAAELAIGAGVQQGLSYLRAVLPSETGYVSTRAVQALNGAQGGTNVVFESTWETWDDLQAHQKSATAESNVLRKLRPALPLDDLVVRIFREID